MTGIKQKRKPSQKSIFLKPSLVVGNTKMWYNQTEVATKEELENVKEMIEVSARLVGTYSANEVTSYTIPVSFDYLIVRTLYSESSKSYWTVGAEMAHIVPGGSAILHGNVYSSWKEDGVEYTGYLLRMINFTVNNKTVSFASWGGGAQKVLGVTIEAYKYQQSSIF